MQNLDFLHEALKKDLRQWAASIYSNVVSTSVLEKSCRCRADKIVHCIILTCFVFLYNCQILILYLRHQHYIFMDFEENVITWFEQNLWEWDCINLLHVSVSLAQPILPDPKNLGWFPIPSKISISAEARLLLQSLICVCVQR